MPDCLVRVRLLFVIALFGLAPSTFADGIEPINKPVRVVLRADWTQPEGSSWVGAFELAQGRIESVRPLAVRDGQIGILPSTDPTEVHFRSEGPAVWAGLEIVVVAPPRSNVRMTVDKDELKAPLDELLQGAVMHIDSASQVRLHRDAADILPVRVKRSSLIFATGDTVDFDVEFRLLGTETRVVNSRFQVAMRTARDGPWLFSQEATLKIPMNAESPSHSTVTVRMPSSEGVYNLVIRAEPEGLAAQERVVQFIVLSPTAAPPNTTTEFEPRLVQEFDPAQPAAGGRWYSTRRLRARTARLGQFLWNGVRHPFSTPVKDETPVAAFRLNIDNPGRSHVLTIDYEDAGNLHLAAAISELDPQGIWTQLPVTGGIRTDEKPSTGTAQSHQLVFWPQTKQPTITLSVDGTPGLAAVKKVRVQEMPRGLPALDVTEPESAHRYFGLFLDNPDTWAAWSSGRMSDASPRLAVDDWRTFLDSASHLTEYARFAGHNSIMATVVGQGGALYPSKTVDANFRLDNGMLADSAADPMQKDVVELLSKLCQRARLAFFPAVRYDGALPAIDRSADESDARRAGLLLVSRDGSIWDSEWGGVPAGQRYNPLNPQVQAAMLDVIKELAARYSSQPAIEGFALDLAPNCHLVLPGLEWGYDDATVQLFKQETGVELPADTKDDTGRFARRYQILTTSFREQWVAWRCRRLSGFYEQALAELRRAKPSCLLFLNLTSLADPADEPRDVGRSGRTIEESLRSKGIDLRNWAAPRGVVVLRPFVATGSSPEGLQLNASREIDELMVQMPSRGSLCIHRPDVLSLVPQRGPQDKSGENGGEPVSVPLVSPGRVNIRRYTQSLAAGDCLAIFEGGPIVPLGQEQAQREFARVFRALPANDFRPLETLQPVVVRSSRDARDALICLLNDASYSVETNIEFHCGSHAMLTNGATGDRLTTQAVEHGVASRLTLEPYQTMFLRLSGADSRVTQCEVVVPQSAERGLRGRFDRLKQAMAIMGSDSARTLEGLPPNGDFEEPGDGDAPARWSAEGDTALIASDTQILHGGARSLRLTGLSASTVASEFFAPPDGRSLAMNVWLRASQPDTHVRWFLTGEHNNDMIYRRYADVAVGTGWEPKQFRARDLPEGLIQHIQVKFQLLDEGSLWIDEARVCALPISQDEKLAISKSVSAIFKAWRERRWSDFERLSEGYWPTYLVETVESAKKDPEP
jgi:hypothetical protein